MNHKKLCESVLERDQQRCQDCGKGDGLEIHHIISRGREGSWDLSNLISLCAYCHRLKDKKAGAHTTEARKRHLNHLRDTYGYEYTGRLWLQALDEANKDNDT